VKIARVFADIDDVTVRFLKTLNIYIHIVCYSIVVATFANARRTKWKRKTEWKN
jgi:hypothetical protein